MKVGKQYLSMLLTLGLLYGAAWAVGSLFGLLYNASMPMWLCAVLLAEMAVLYGSRRFSNRPVTGKIVVGTVFVVSLVLALGYSLYYAGVYVVAWLTDLSLGTSFPWYTGFAFSGMIVGPVILVTGIAWTVMHLRERKRNVKDIRLLVRLALIGTALWAVIWTVLRIRQVLVYPSVNSHPWHASFVYAFLYFSPWLTLEGVALYLLTRFEKRLTPEDLAVPAPAAEPVPARKPINWPAVLCDSAVVILPLLVVSVLMAVLWDTGYLTLNIGLVICSTLTVCLVIGLAAWLAYHRFGAGRLRDIRLLTGVMMLATVAAMVAWTVWYSKNRLDGLTGLPSNWVYTLALGFFGPVFLGEGIMLVLLTRLERRLSGTVPAEQPGKAWALLLAAVLVMQCAVLWCQFSGMEYKDELDVTVKKVSYPQYGVEGHFMPTIQADYDVAWIRDTKEEVRGEGMFLTCTTTWNPLREIGDRQVGWNLYPDENVRYLYVYKPGIGFELILVKDPDTGLWEFYE